MIEKIKTKVKPITDLAFLACDDDGSMSLEENELSAVMKEVAYLMKVTAPTKDDIKSTWNARKWWPGRDVGAGLGKSWGLLGGSAEHGRS